MKTNKYDESTWEGVSIRQVRKMIHELQAELREIKGRSCETCAYATDARSGGRHRVFMCDKHEHGVRVMPHSCSDYRKGGDSPKRPGFYQTALSVFQKMGKRVA